MSWDAAGAIGEILGAIAVTATLFYLALQTKRARIATEAQGTIQSASLHAEWRRSVMQNAEVSELIAKANQGDQLTEAEEIRMRTTVEEWFVAGCAAYVSGRSSGAAHDLDSELEYMANMLADNPGLLPHWERFAYVVERVSSEYKIEVDKLLERKQGQRRGA